MSLSRNQKRFRHKRSLDEATDASALQQMLEQLLPALPFSVPAGSASHFVQFIQLLHKWNAAYNLTSVRDMKLMVTRHILDSIVINPYLHGQQILDVGSGAGLPGIPLAIINPECYFTLLDSNNKKTRFIQQAVTELGLQNVTVITERIENFHPDQRFDTVTARAYSAIENLIAGVAQLLAADGVILAMKGTYPVAELEVLPDGYRIERVEPLIVPGLDAERHLVMIRPNV